MTGPWIFGFALLAAATGVLGVLMLALARHVAALSTRLPQPLPLELSQGPSVGSRLDQDVSATELAEIGVADVPSRDILFVFLSTNCSVCYSLIDDLNRYSRENSDSTAIAVITGPAQQANRMAGALEPTRVIADATGDVTRRFGIGTVPFALLYANRALRAKGVVNSRDMLESLAQGRVRKDGDELLAAFENAGSL